MKITDTYFLSFIDFVLKWEGEDYENDKDDPGGETHYGIDKRSHPNVDIKNLTKEEAISIYYKEYLDAKSDLLPGGLRECYFDSVVNVGKKQAVLFLQRACGVKADGLLGPVTLAATLKGDIRLTIFKFLDQREAFYQDLVKAKPKLAKFEKGWLNRVDDLKEYVCELVS